MMFVVQGEKGDRIPTPGIFHSSQGVGQEINAFPAKNSLKIFTNQLNVCHLFKIANQRFIWVWRES
jgi:hypothetical protein